MRETTGMRYRVVLPGCTMYVANDSGPATPFTNAAARITVAWNTVPRGWRQASSFVAVLVGMSESTAGSGLRSAMERDVV